MSRMYWILDDDHNPVPASLEEWGRMYEDPNARTVDYTALHVAGAKEVHVSTVFLGIDHGFGRGPPVLFETMVFGGKLDESQWRYRTWDEAAAGHKAVVAELMARYVVSVAGQADGG